MPRNRYNPAKKTHNLRSRGNAFHSRPPMIYYRQKLAKTKSIDCVSGFIPCPNFLSTGKRASTKIDTRSACWQKIRGKAIFRLASRRWRVTRRKIAFRLPFFKGLSAVSADTETSVSAALYFHSSSNPLILNFSVRQFSVTVRTTSSETPSGESDGNVDGNGDFDTDLSRQMLHHFLEDFLGLGSHFEGLHLDGTVEATQFLTSPA